MTDDAIRAERVAELQRRRAAGARPDATAVATVDPVAPVESVASVTRRIEGSSKSGIAGGSKIAATGLGFTTMLGLVAGMGLANRSSDAESELVPLSTTPTRIVVVVHPAGGSSVDSSASSNVNTVTSNEPVALTAQPVVQQAPVSPAPSGRTNGSR